MSFSTVAAFAGPHPRAPEVLEVASAIMTPFGRLIALAASPDAGREPVHASEQGQAVAPADLQAAHARYEALTAARGTHRVWRVASGSIEGALIDASLTSDLVVLPVGAGEALDVQRIVANAAGPVLLVPPQDQPRFACRNALIAWDGSRSAARAVRDALPLLRTASEVAVLHVSEPDEKVDIHVATGAIVAWLADHGIEAYGCEMARCTDGICATLFETAVERGADLIVAGAFGRNWVPNWIGGMSARMTRDAPVACLLSH